MAEIKKGSFTLPGEAGFEPDIKNGRKMGADVIRDSDGTKLSEDILQRQGMVLLYDLRNPVPIMHGRKEYG